MRLQPGSVVRGDDFFGREDLVEAILASLRRGQHVLLTAPRRFGRTSVLERVLGRLPPDWKACSVRCEEVREASG